MIYNFAGPVKLDVPIDVGIAALIAVVVVYFGIMAVYSMVMTQIIRFFAVVFSDDSEDNQEISKPRNLNKLEKYLFLTLSVSLPLTNFLVFNFIYTLFDPKIIQVLVYGFPVILSVVVSVVLSLILYKRKYVLVKK